MYTPPNLGNRTIDTGGGGKRTTNADVKSLMDVTRLRSDFSTSQYVIAIVAVILIALACFMMGVYVGRTDTSLHEKEAKAAIPSAAETLASAKTDELPNLAAGKGEQTTPMRPESATHNTSSWPVKDTLIMDSTTTTPPDRPRVADHPAPSPMGEAAPVAQPMAAVTPATIVNTPATGEPSASVTPTTTPTTLPAATTTPAALPAATTTPAVTTTPVAMTPTTAPATTTPAPEPATTTLTPAPAPATTIAPLEVASAIPAQNPASAPAAVAQPAATAIPSQVVASAEPKVETPVAATAAKTPAAKSAKGGYSIQVAALSGPTREKKAEECKRNLEQSPGCKDVRIVRSADGKYIRVMIGQYADRKSASEACNELRKRPGLTDCIVKAL